MNPSLDSDFLRSGSSVTLRLAAEYEARFLGSGGVFLHSDQIAAAVDERDELDASTALDLIAGLDPVSRRIRLV